MNVFILCVLLTFPIIFIPCIPFLCILSKMPIISFKSFINFYPMNPNRWYIKHFFYVEYEIRDTNLNFFDSYHKYRFNFIDTIRFIFWRIAKNKIDKEVKQTKEITLLLKNIQKDIDKSKRNNFIDFY